MGFLDNSSDITLDLVLTDLGRKRLAQADGTFKVAKFALGDDEIDYSLYNKNHSSGSAYFDLELLQTPILEAMTNNMSSMHSKLLTINRTNLLWLPVIKVNTDVFPMATTGQYRIAVDTDTEAQIANGTLTSTGLINGETIQNTKVFFRFDQGLDTSEISPAVGLDPDLIETQYLVEMDNRFGYLASTLNNVVQPSTIDDDDIASYYFSLGTDTEFVKQNPSAADSTATNEIIAGPRGTILEFKIKSSLELNTNEYLFNTIGTTNDTDATIKQIYSTIRITGVTTGFSVDVPVVFMKKI